MTSITIFIALFFCGVLSLVAFISIRRSNQTAEIEMEEKSLLYGIRNDDEYLGKNIKEKRAFRKIDDDDDDDYRVRTKSKRSSGSKNNKRVSKKKYY